MKILKIAGAVAAAVVIVAAGGVAYVATQFDSGRIKTEAIRAVKEATQRTLKIDGDVRLSIWPDLALDVGKMSLSEPDSARIFASLNSARVSVAVLPLLERKIDVHAVEIRGLHADLIRNKNGKLNAAGLMPGAGHVEAGSGSGKGHNGGVAPLRFDVASVKVTNAAMTWRDQRAGTTFAISGLQLHTGRVQADAQGGSYSIDALALAVKGRNESKSGAYTFDVKVDAPKLVLGPEKSGAGKLTLSARLRGGQRTVSALLALSGVEGGAKRIKVANLVFDVDAKAGKTAVKGKLESGLDVNWGAHVAALKKIFGRLEITNPDIPAGRLALPLSGSLHADFAKNTAQGRIATRLDESNMSLVIGATRFSPPALTFNVDVDRLNLDRYLKRSAQPAGGHGGTPSSGTGGDKIDLSGLKGLNLSGTARFGRLQVAGVKLENVRLRLRAAHGRLDLAPIAASLYGGSTSGALTLDANGNAIALKQDFANISIGPLIRDAANKDLLDGRGKLAIAVTTRGATIEAMKRALAGTARIALRNGAIKGINLARSLRELKAKFRTGYVEEKPSNTSEQTDFSELTASFQIAEGVAHNADLSAKAPFLRLSGSGDIDIGAGTLDYLIKTSVVATAKGQGGNELAQLRGVTVPVRLTGPLEHPRWRIELAALATQAVKAKIEEKGKEVRNKVEEQIGKRLKDLFGK